MEYDKITRAVRVTEATCLIVHTETETVEKRNIVIYGWCGTKTKVRNAVKRLLKADEVLLYVIKAVSTIRHYEMAGQEFIDNAKEVL